MRAKLQWKPNDNLNAQFTFHFNEDRADCCGVPLVRLDSGAHLFGVPQLTPAVAIAGITPGPDNTGVRVNQVPIANAEDIGFTSHIAYDFGKVTLLAITGIDSTGTMRANLSNVRGNWTFPTAAGTAYTQELPRDYFRYFGLRVAYSSK